MEGDVRMSVEDQGYVLEQKIQQGALFINDVKPRRIGRRGGMDHLEKVRFHSMGQSGEPLDLVSIELGMGPIYRGLGFREHLFPGVALGDGLVVVSLDADNPAFPYQINASPGVRAVAHDVACAVNMLDTQAVDDFEYRPERFVVGVNV